MKAFGLAVADSLASLLVGPLRFVSSWWWRKRLTAVHSQLGMESYHPRA